MKPAFPTIRPAVWGDLAELAQLHRDVFHWEAWDERALADVFAMPVAAGLVAVDQAAPVGFALYTVVAEDAELLTLAVQHDARRRGVASELVHRFLAIAAKAGATQALLEVAADNPGAQRLYERLGFRNESTRNNYYKRPGKRQVSAHLLRLPLQRITEESRKNS